MDFQKTKYHATSHQGRRQKLNYPIRTCFFVSLAKQDGELFLELIVNYLIKKNICKENVFSRYQKLPFCMLPSFAVSISKSSQLNSEMQTFLSIMIIHFLKQILNATINYFSSKECDILHGECIQTYVPYLFLVIPLGPVTLTGQVDSHHVQCILYSLPTPVGSLKK